MQTAAELTNEMFKAQIKLSERAARNRRIWFAIACAGGTISAVAFEYAIWLENQIAGIIVAGIMILITALIGMELNDY